MVTSVHATSHTDDTSGFRQYWLAETIRLRESQWGPLHDSTEIRRARALGHDFAHRVLLRALFLGRREGTDTLIRSWANGAKLAFLILLALAVLTGSGAALGALGDGSRPVNIILALTALLGLHALTFLFWCISSFVPSNGSHTGLGDLWLWLTRKVARGPDVALVPRALLSLLGRQRALRPLLGAVSHTVWFTALLAMLLTLVALLSARRYAFNWETTLLSPDAFVTITQGLGWLPAKLGFNIPSETIIRASDGLQALPDFAQAQWSSWLIGCLVCYGLFPRLLALLFTATQAALRMKRVDLDIRLPGYIELRDRLDPSSLPGGIDAPAPAPEAKSTAQHDLRNVDGTRAVVGLELGPDTPWPLAGIDPNIADLGVIDDRPQRQSLLDTLHAHPPAQLLIVCDGRQTPDRGMIGLITEIVSSVAQSRILVLPATSATEDQRAERIGQWMQQLQHAGLRSQTIETNIPSALAWLDSDITTAPHDMP